MGDGCSGWVVSPVVPHAADMALPSRCSPQPVPMAEYFVPPAPPPPPPVIPSAQTAFDSPISAPPALAPGSAAPPSYAPSPPPAPPGPYSASPPQAGPMGPPVAPPPPPPGPPAVTASPAHSASPPAPAMEPRKPQIPLMPMSDARSDLLAAIRRGKRQGQWQLEGGGQVPSIATTVAKYLLV